MERIQNGRRARSARLRLAEFQQNSTLISNLCAYVNPCLQLWLAPSLVVKIGVSARRAGSTSPGWCKSEEIGPGGAFPMLHQAITRARRQLATVSRTLDQKPAGRTSRRASTPCASARQITVKWLMYHVVISLD